MAKKALLPPLVVSGELKAAKQLPNSDDNGIRLAVLDLAAVHRHDAVAARLIDSGHDAAVPRHTEGGLHFVAVMVGILHSQNGFHLVKFPQQTPYLRLLPFQLLRIAQILQLAASTFLRIGTTG